MRYDGSSQLLYCLIRKLRIPVIHFRGSAVINKRAKNCRSIHISLCPRLIHNRIPRKSDGSTRPFHFAFTRVPVNLWKSYTLCDFKNPFLKPEYILEQGCPNTMSLRTTFTSQTTGRTTDYLILWYLSNQTFFLKSTLIHNFSDFIYQTNPQRYKRVFNQL